jgi:hypothetical protein
MFHFLRTKMESTQQTHIPLYTFLHGTSPLKFENHKRVSQMHRHGFFLTQLCKRKKLNNKLKLSLLWFFTFAGQSAFIYCSVFSISWGCSCLHEKISLNIYFYIGLTDYPMFNFEIVKIISGVFLFLFQCYWMRLVLTLHSAIESAFPPQSLKWILCKCW